MCQLPGDQAPEDGHLDKEDVMQDEHQHQHQHQQGLENPQEALLAEEGR